MSPFQSMPHMENAAGKPLRPGSCPRQESARNSAMADRMSLFQPVLLLLEAAHWVLSRLDHSHTMPEASAAAQPYAFASSISTRTTRIVDAVFGMLIFQVPPLV